MNDNQLRVILKQGEHNKVIFAAVDSKYTKHTEDAGIHYFPTDEALRTFRLGKTNVIYLDKVPNSNCKKCYGTGSVGKNVLVPDEKKVAEVLKSNWDNKDLAKGLIEEMRYPYDLVEPMEMLLKVMHRDLTEDNASDTMNEEKKNKVFEYYARIIKQDFEFKEVVWCECFIKNLQEEVNAVIKNQQFAIN